jgi:hypothetical protein
VLAQPQPAGDPGQRPGADHRRPVQGEDALADLGPAPEEQLSGDQLDDGVAEELQPLVVAIDLGGVLVGEGAVRQRALEQAFVLEGDLEALLQRLELGTGGGVLGRALRR